MKLLVYLVIAVACLHCVTSQGARYSCRGRCHRYQPRLCSCERRCRANNFGCCDDYILTCHGPTLLPPSPVPASCSREPPTVKNGFFEPSDLQVYYEGVTLTYSCNRGYSPNQDDVTSTCRNGRWNPSTIHLRCRRSLFPTCGPPDVADGNLQFEPFSLSYLAGHNVVFSCPPGYRVDGPPAATCVATNVWEPAPFPTCRRITCRHRPAPSSGGYRPAGKTSWYPRDVATYGCNNCYRLDGQASSTCQNDGSWNHDRPTCVPLCRYPSHPSGGYIFPTRGGCYRPRATVTYHCDEGYRLKGESEVTCGFDGRWSHTPVCEALTCPHRPAPSTGSYEPVGVTTWYEGDEVTYSCRSCLRLVGSRRSTCRRGRQWSHAVPRCLPKCRLPRNPANGFIAAARKLCFDDGDIIRYRCSSGYRLEGRAAVTCNEGSWSHAPTCKRVECPHRPAPTKGSYAPAGKTTWYVRDVVEFSCLPYYYLVGSNSSECRPNGRWSAPVPTCRLISPCRGRCTAEYSAGAVCQCNPYCDEECCPDAGLCDPDPCPPLPPLRWGSVDIRGNRATYSCDDGYRLHGDAGRVCVNGRWIGGVPECRPNQQDPPAPVDSCQGRCGLPGDVDYPCDCDDECEFYNQCCHDYIPVCT